MSNGDGRERIWVACGAVFVCVVASISASAQSITQIKSAAGISCSGALPNLRHSGPIAVDCDNPEQLLECNAQTSEPLDILTKDVCRKGAITLVNADEIPMRVDSPSPMTVEWIELSGSELRTIARRPFVVATVVSLSVGKSQTRLLRFLRHGASPLTLDAGSLRERAVASLPTAVSGGELIILNYPATVAAAAYRIDSGAIFALSNAHVMASLQGILSGKHELTPLYQGEMPGQPIGFEIRDGASTIVPVTPQQLGGLVISAMGQCGETLQLARWISDAHSSILEPVGEFAPLTDCMWSIGGLPPGRYRATLGLGDQRGFVDVVVAAQQVRKGTVDARQVEVTGRVLLNGEPYSTRRVRFQLVSEPFAGETTTDANGEYRLELPKPGEYRTLVGSGGFNSRALLHAGANVINLDITGGVIDVVVEGGVTTTNVEVKGNGFIATQQVEPGTERTWEGLRFGQYTISAQGDRIVSEARRVTLSSEEPHVSVRLHLTPNSSELTVTNEAGAVVGGVTFPRLLTPPSEISPGRFALTAIPPGTELRVRPPKGFSPTCHVVRANETRQVSVLPARKVTFVFDGVQGYELGTDFGMVEGIEGAECGVPLRDFGVLLTRRTDSAFVVEVENFPIGGLGMRVSTALGTRNITVDPNGIASILLKLR